MKKLLIAIAALALVGCTSTTSDVSAVEEAPEITAQTEVEMEEVGEVEEAPVEETVVEEAPAEEEKETRYATLEDYLASANAAGLTGRYSESNCDLTITAEGDTLIFSYVYPGKYGDEDIAFTKQNFEARASSIENDMKLLLQDLIQITEVTDPKITCTYKDESNSFLIENTYSL